MAPYVITHTDTPFSKVTGIWSLIYLPDLIFPERHTLYKLKLSYFVSVSYTHLDVYKRQVNNYLIDIPIIHLASTADHKINYEFSIRVISSLFVSWEWFYLHTGQAHRW